MPDKKKRRLTTQCSICNGPSATHLHYGAVACYSCRAFFRRGIGKPYCCVEGTGDCSIDLTNRRSCQWCRFDRCLKAGMKPELVDASFRRKTFNKKHNASFEEPILIDNFRPLEKDDISDFLQDIAGASSQPLMSGDSLQSVEAGGNIYFLESEADLFNLSYVAPPPPSDSYSYSLSPSSSSYSSSLSPSSSSYSEYGDMSSEASMGQGYTININITDIENQIFDLPESLYCGGQQTAREQELSHLETSFTALNTLEQDEAGLDEEESEEEEEDVRNSFDIETLVDECFMNETSRRGVIVQS